MNQKTLVMYEISQKQKYIFRTNRLIENIGASAIIRNLTENPHEFFLNFPKYLDKKSITLPKYDKKIVGGGNATYIFTTKEKALEFANIFSTTVLRNFPGIELFLITREISDRANEHLYPKNEKYGKLKEMRDILAEKKNRREHATQQLSWGIHQVCSRSGLPTNDYGWDHDSKEKKERAMELIVKEKIGKNALKYYFQEELITNNQYLDTPENYKFFTEDEIEKINERKENEAKNYLAIVHIDGNAMGVKVSSFLEKKFKSNDDYIEKYKKFTEEIDQAYKTAFRKMIHHVMKDYDLWAEVFYGAKETNDNFYEEMKYVIPIRPVVASGDDICYITYGQLGIETARIFIQYLQQERNIQSKSYTFEACAGVAIIKQKFPFWLGYELSEKLCSNAKKRLEKDKQIWIDLKLGSKQKPYDTSLIDWELVKEGDFPFDIQKIRDKYYTNKDGSTLIQRPYYLQRHDAYWKHPAQYQVTFLQAMKQIKQSSIESDSHNHIPPISKWKELREIYYQGKAAVEQWKQLNQFDIGENQLFIDYQNEFALIKKENKQLDIKCQQVAYYFDALEVADYFIPLSEVITDAITYRNY